MLNQEKGKGPQKTLQAPKTTTMAKSAQKTPLQGLWLNTTISNTSWIQRTQLHKKGVVREEKGCPFILFPGHPPLLVHLS